jgi:hypothetical protein
MKTVNGLPGENEEIPGEEHEDHEEFVQEDNREPKEDSVEEDARKDQLSGPANDLISQPDSDEDDE